MSFLSLACYIKSVKSVCNLNLEILLMDQVISHVCLLCLKTCRNSLAGEVICLISTGDVSRLEEGMGSQILHECVRPGQKAKGRTLPEMKVERNKSLGFNLVERRVSLRSLAEGVMLTAQRL